MFFTNGSGSQIYMTIHQVFHVDIGIENGGKTSHDIEDVNTTTEDASAGVADLNDAKLIIQRGNNFSAPIVRKSVKNCMNGDKIGVSSGSMFCYSSLK